MNQEDWNKLSDESKWNLYSGKKELISKEEIEDKYIIINFKDNYYIYYDNNDKQHLIKDGKEIISGKSIYYYGNGFYSYKDDDDINHLFKAGKEIISGEHIWNYGEYLMIILENDLKIKIINEE